MNKDDYFVIVYKILGYLYDCLKAGEDPDKDLISHEYLQINEKYWAMIMSDLQEEGFIDGVSVIKAQKKICGVKINPYVQIKPKGIRYLQENSIFEKVIKYLKEIKAIVPGI